MKIAVITNQYNSHGDKTNGLRVYLSIPRAGEHDSYLVEHLEVSDSRMDTVNIIEQCDLILFMGTAIYPENLWQFEFVKKIKNKNSKIALWYFDACNPDCKFPYIQDKYKRIKSILPHIDYLFTTDHSYPWEKEFENYHHLLQGVDENEFKREHRYLEYSKNIDVIFTGGYTGVHEYRKNDLDFINSFCNLKTYGRSDNIRIYGEDFIHQHFNSRIAYIPTSPPGLRDNYWSNRIYLAAATGIPCVVEHVPGIEEHFEPGREIMITGNQGHLKETILFLLHNPDKANMIGKAGRARVLKDHTYKERIQEMLGVIYG